MTAHDVKVRRAVRMVNDALSLLVMADDRTHECAMAADKLHEAVFWMGQMCAAAQTAAGVTEGEA